MDDSANFINECSNSKSLFNEPIARIYGRGFECIMKKRRIIIGRNSSKGTVDVDIGLSSFVSRNHLEVYLELEKLFLLCLGKNGIFVDNTFKAFGSPPFELPSQCNLRFPSTNTRIFFESLLSETCIVNEASSPLPVKCSNASLHAECNSLSYKRRGLSTHISTPICSYMDLDPDIGSRQINSDICNTSLLSSNMSINNAINSSLHTSARNSISSTLTMTTDTPLERTLTQVHNVGLSNTSMSSDSNNTHMDHYHSMSYHIDSTGSEDGAESDSEVQLDRGNDFTKPPYSYAQMIVQAINSTPDRQLTLSGIYGYIVQNFTYYKQHDKGWQNSIRHNLSLNRYFIKVARHHDEPGKGSFWRIDPMYEDKLFATAYRKRRQRGIHVFTAAQNSSIAVPSKNVMKFTQYHFLRSPNCTRLLQQIPAVTSAGTNSSFRKMDLPYLPSQSVSPAASAGELEEGNFCLLPVAGATVLQGNSTLVVRQASCQRTVSNNKSRVLLNHASLKGLHAQCTSSCSLRQSADSSKTVCSGNILRVITAPAATHNNASRNITLSTGQSLLLKHLPRNEMNLRFTNSTMNSSVKSLVQHPQIIDLDEEVVKTDDDLDNDSLNSSRQDLMLGAAVVSLEQNFE